MRGRTITGLAVATAFAAVLSATLSACGGHGDEKPETPPSTDANAIGRFGPVFDWPIIAMHLALLPDGRVMSFGTSSQGLQGAELHYVVWDPTQGTDAASLLLLPNTTTTDISCAGQTLVPATGELLIVGGDRTVNGRRNYANSDVNVFDASTNQLIQQPASMTYQRWYATAVTTADDAHVVLGGLLDRTYEPAANYPAFTPEVFRPGTGWRDLPAANSETAFAAGNEGWYYPRAWLAPDGSIFMLGYSGEMFRLTHAGEGSIESLPGNAGPSASTLPSVMFEPGRILSVRDKTDAVIVDIRNATRPTIESSGHLNWERRYGNATLLADGRVWVNGGSNTGNDLAGAAYHSEIWSPATRRWANAAPAVKARLYHSASLLLPDATVLTSGGGAPGPQKNLNSEIYYPPYLFKPGPAGDLAPRPRIASAPTTVGHGQRFDIQMAEAAPLSRVTLVRAGSVTHAFNNDQRFIEMTWQQDGTKVQLRAPEQPNLAPPGFYLLFAFDAQGVPSVASVVRLFA